MSLVVTTVTDGTLPVTLAEAQSQLAYLDTDQNAHIESLLAAATDWAERYTQRTLRVSVSRTLSVCDWWSDPLVLAHPPVASVTSVKYSDADNAEQTLSSANYHVLNDTNGTTKLYWASTATLPVLYDRPDAIRILYVTGYGSVAAVPAVVKQAIKLMVQSYWNQDDGRDLERAEKCAKDLLGTVDWPRYA